MFCPCSYKLRSTSTPSYLSTFLQPVTSSRSLRSVDSFRVQFQRIRTGFGSSPLRHPYALPNKPRLNSSLSTFKKHLKSLLFSTAFMHVAVSPQRLSLCIFTTSWRYINTIIWQSTSPEPCSCPRRSGCAVQQNQLRRTKLPGLRDDMLECPAVRTEISGVDTRSFLQSPEDKSTQKDFQRNYYISDTIQVHILCGRFLFKIFRNLFYHVS